MVQYKMLSLQVRGVFSTLDCWASVCNAVPTEKRCDRIEKYLLDYCERPSLSSRVFPGLLQTPTTHI